MTREELLKSIEDTKRYIKKKMLKMTCPEALRDFIDFYIRAYLNKRDEKEWYVIEIVEDVVRFGEKLYARRVREYKRGEK